jgi:hypothetical protein
MALKGDRFILEWDVTKSCPVVAEEGVVLVQNTSGSGVAIGDTAGSATLAASASGTVPAGILVGNVVNVDVTRYHLNFQKNETLIGMKVSIVRKGRLTTNKVTGSPTVGSTAYLTANGVLTPTLSATGGLVATPKVGVFQGALDENGYATVDINLPIA